MYISSDLQVERSKLWKDVLSVVESEENVEKTIKVERNFAYDLFRSVQCKSTYSEEYQIIDNEEGDPMDFDEKPEKFLLVFPNGQTIEIEQNILTEKLYKPYELLNYPLDKDKEWLFNIKDLHCQHSVFSNLNDSLEELETCTMALDIRKKPLHYDNKSLLISTIDFLTAFMNELIQAVQELNLVKFSNMISSKAILMNELGEAYEISQDAALKILNLDKYGFSIKKNQTELQTVYTEGYVHFKSIPNPMDTDKFHELTRYALSKILKEEQLTNPFILLSLVNVRRVEKSSLSNDTKEYEISSLNIEEIIHEQSIHLDKWNNSIQLNNINNFIIQASRTIDTNDLEKYLNFNDLISSTNSMDILFCNMNNMNISKRTHLKSIWFNELAFSDNVFKKMLVPFEHLRCIELNTCNIGSDAIQYLSQKTSLRELELLKCKIRSEWCLYLSQSTTISKLNLSWNEIGPKGCQYLSLSTCIRKLDLSNNNIRDEGCQYLSQNTSIRELKLSENKIRSDGLQYLSQNKSIRELNLSENFIRSVGCRYLSQNTSIKVLDLTNNYIRSEGCRCLSLNTSIRQLNLAKNYIGPKGCNYISLNTSIIELNLSSNDIRTIECQYISQSTTLRNLDLSDNYIKSEGCQYLSINTSIRTLNLSKNYIGLKGCQYFSLNTSIRELDLSENNIGPEGCRHISFNTSIRTLKLFKNDIGL